MKDPVGILLAISFVVIAIAVFVRGKQSRLQGFTIVMLCALAVVTLTRERITELTVSYKEFKVALSRVENRLEDIAEVLDTLVVAQQIEKLTPDNSILLDYDPVPKSIRIVCGPLTHFPREEYGYHLDGRNIRIINEQTLRIVQNRLPGGVTVEYLRRVGEHR